MASISAVAVCSFPTSASAKDAWESAANGICLFKASSEPSAELTKELNFQFKSTLRGGDALSDENFRVDDGSNLLNGAVLRQIGFNGQVMSLVSRSADDANGSAVIGLMVTISNPPQKYSHAAIVAGAVGSSEPATMPYVGMCSFEELTTGADFAWQAITEETSKAQ